MVEYIEYKKKKYPVRVSYFALKKVREETGEDFTKAIQSAQEDGGVNFDMSIYESMLYYALIAGAEATDTKMELKKEKMEFVLDECFIDFINLMQKFFPQEMIDGKKIAPGKNRQQKRSGKILVEEKKK